MSENERRGTPASSAPLAREVGHTRYVVLLGVAAVLLVSMSLFVLGAGLAVQSLWHAATSLLRGDAGSTTVSVEILEIVSTMLKAVIFYLVGVGLYSLFIAPLNLPIALGVETLNDLEAKLISVVVVIMAITFLEHFIGWQQPYETMLFGVALAAVVAALVLFQFYLHRAKDDQRINAPEVQEAQRDLFERDHEKRDVPPADAPDGRAAPRERRS